MTNAPDAMSVARVLAKNAAASAFDLTAKNR
jgi:hypothetical protein